MTENLNLNAGEDTKSTLKSVLIDDESFKYKAGAFLASVAGLSGLVGFGAAVGSAKKHDPKYFEKGVMGSRQMGDTGVNLAIRALGWGTLYALTGCGILFYSIWKLSGATNFVEFRENVGSILPKIPKNDPPRGRTEFSGLNDLLGYLASGSTERDPPQKD